MLEHVAMKNIATRVTIETNQNGEHVSGTDHRGVLPAAFTGMRLSWLPNKLQGAIAKDCNIEPLTVHDPKLNQM